MSKSRIGLDKIKESKGRTNWATLRTQVDAQIRASTMGNPNSRELSDVELKQLTKPKKI